MDILLLSTYELGHQPLGLGRPAAHLLAAGHSVRCIDLAVEPLDVAAVRAADLIGVSVPMHTATRLGVRLAERLRALNPTAHICFYGLYASLNAAGLLGRYADSVIGGEYESPLVDLASNLGSPARAASAEPTPLSLAGQQGGGSGIPGVMTMAGQGEVNLGRQRFALPRRDLLPPLDRYARLDDGRRQKLVGYVEASRGCAHRCLHCPITPVYQGRLRVVQEEVVLDDIRQLVQMGAEHITFGDPDFFNGIKHSLRLVEALREEFPVLTYDATIKVEHLLEHRQHLARLRETGCVFVLSAVEAVDDEILANLDKGHRAADVETALDLVETAGLVLRPTFVAFTPWTTPAGYLQLLDFIERRGLISHVDAIQLAIRLLVPPGSSLLGSPALAAHLGAFDEATLTYTWKHPNPRLDNLQLEVAALVERAARDGLDSHTSFAQIKQLAWARLADRPAPSTRPQPATASAVPRLTEPWFC